MKIAVIGSGTWGTSLAQILADNGHNVLVYAVVPEQCEDINKNHKNARFFGEDVILNKKVKASSNLEEVLKDRSIIVLSVPTAAESIVLEKIRPLLTKKVTFISTAKGFDPATNETMSQVIRRVIPEELRNPIVSLLGPGHAEEVILRKYSTINSICKNISYAKKIQKLFANSYFRGYTSKDEIGTEIAASLKNGIAIASGILVGLKQGDNARAALITRGMQEIVRFGKVYGAKSETFAGLSGIGDLIVTACSPLSRNYQAGLHIGVEGNADALFAGSTTIEGLRTIATVHSLNETLKLDLPIFDALYNVIYNRVKPEIAIHNLFTRPLRAE